VAAAAPASPAAPRPRWHLWAGWLLLALYAWLLGRSTVVVAGGSDSSGYLNAARLLASGRLELDVRIPAEFGPRAAAIPMHFLPSGFFPGGRDPAALTPTYPSGLPLQFAGAAHLFGWTAGPFAVALLSALAAVWLTYLAARELDLPPPLAVAGAVVLAAFPVFLFSSIQPLSDTPATAWSMASVYAALRTRRQPRWALAAGAAFAMGVLIRPTNLLLAPAMLLLLGRVAGVAHFARSGTEGNAPPTGKFALPVRRLLYFVAGGLPGALWLGFYNHTLYGHPLISGYGGISGAFSWAYGWPTAAHFARWLALLLPAAVLVLPLAIATRPELRRGTAVALLTGFAAVAGFYLFYRVSQEEWWCLRFLLPATPLLILAALLGVEALARRWSGGTARHVRNGAALALALWAIGSSFHWCRRLDVFRVPEHEQLYLAAATAARAHLPAKALVVCLHCSGSLYYYREHPILRWDQIGPEEFARYVALARAAGRPVCAVLFDFEEEDAFRRCPGPWQRLARTGPAGLWQLGPAPNAAATPR
jgi:hypothetical protein